MSTLSDLLYAQGRSTPADVEWLHRLAGDGQLLADLAFADIVIWVPTADDSFIAVAHTRPSGAATLFYRDIVGDQVRPQWRTQVREAFQSGNIVDSASPDWFEETPTRVRAVPIVRSTPGGCETLGVLTRHTNLGDARTPSRQQLTFNDCADDLFRMIASGEFPDPAAPTSPRRGAPRASDGLIRLDVDGMTIFASPNALSAFNRLGFDDELEGESLVEVVTRILPLKHQFDETLPVVVTGRAPWRADIEARGVTVSLRTIPLKDRGARIGAIVLCRDVTEIRHQEQELITKDATIREIHHRVKNNLQIISSLLSMQQRAVADPAARAALGDTRQRITALALIYRTLYQSEDIREADSHTFLTELVGQLVAGEAMRGPLVTSSVDADYLIIDPDRLAPVALWLVEAVSNAQKHAFAGRGGDLQVRFRVLGDTSVLEVQDDGPGMYDADATGVGRTLMNAFAKQLRGHAEMIAAPDGGSIARLTFATPEAPAPAASGSLTGTAPHPPR